MPAAGRRFDGELRLQRMISAYGSVIWIGCNRTNQHERVEVLGGKIREALS